MRQEQIKRRPQRSNPPDDGDSPDMPAGVPEHAANASRDASDMITRITKEIDQ